MAFPTKPAKVLLSLMTEENDYQRAQLASAEAVARSHGIVLEVLYAQNDAVTQVQQILTAIQRRDHGIECLIVAPVGTAMLNVAEVATNAGIAWCLLNREADYISRLRASTRAPVFEVSIDQLELGRLQAAQVATLLPSGGTVLYITGPVSGSSSALRSQGFQEKKPDNIRVKTITGSWTEESGYRAVTSLLKLSTTRAEGFSAVVSQNDAMAAGARRAFAEVRESGQQNAWLTMPFLGIDGLPSTGQQYVHRKQLTATIITPAVAGLALDAFVQWRNHGKLIPERMLVNSDSYPAIDKLRSSVAGAG